MLDAGKWPRGPVAPTSLAGTGSDTEVALTWTAPATTHGTITDYAVEYTPSGGSPTVVLTGSTAESYTVTGLTNDTEYAVRVAGINHTQGEWSTSVAVTPLAGFDPTSITGLEFWVDGSDASTLFDATSGGSLVAAGGSVARIEDKSGNSRHITGTGMTRTAAGQNGLDVVAITTGQRDLSMSLAASDLTFVFAYSSSSSSGKLFQSSSPLLVLYHDVTGLVKIYAGAFKDFGGAVSSVTTPQVATFRLESANAGFFRNGVQQGTASSYSQVAIGGSIGFFNQPGGTVGTTAGNFFECLIYSSALSSTDREAVENYLIAKWGI